MHLPGWRYPVVVDTASGSLSYDNYGERWGEQALLARWMGRLKRAFHAVEKSQAQVARLEREIARLEGHS